MDSKLIPRKGNNTNSGSPNSGNGSSSNLNQKGRHDGKIITGENGKISNVSSTKSVTPAGASEDNIPDTIKYDPSARRSEGRKLHRRRRSSRTRSRDKFFEGTQETEERYPYGDTYAEGAGGKDDLNRVSEGEFLHPGEKLSTQLVDPVKPSEREVKTAKAGCERASGGEVFPKFPNRELPISTDPPSSTNQKDIFKRKKTDDTYIDIYFKKHITETTSNAKLDSDQGHQTKLTKVRPTLKRKLHDQEIKWKTISDLPRESTHVVTPDPGITRVAKECVNRTEPDVKEPEPEDAPSDLAEGLPLNTYLENYLHQNMDFLHAYLRTPAEVLAGTRESSAPVTRLTVTPQSPPGIGYTEHIRPREISPASSLHELETLPRPKVDELKTMSKLSSAKESFRKFVQLQRESLSHIISSQQNFFQKKFQNDEEKRPFWRSKFLEKNRMENKSRNKTYAMTVGWELKRRKIRPVNKTLISNLLRVRNSKKYKAAMRYNPLKKKQKVMVPPHILDEYSYLLNEYNKNYAPDLMEPQLLKTSDSFASLPVDRPLLDHPPFTNFNSPHIYPETPSFTKESKPEMSAYTSWKSKNKFNKYDQNNPVTSILEDSSKVSEKTQALLQASGGKLPIRFPHARPTANTIFNPEALLKIYSPKTEFTRQFTDLLPNGSFHKS
ncbi:unnamed protein product [Allacma fusca]|uniref:Uncharacterized protein n=1 Tax=Allacma fusca TaxID=39272 RepID=A0A8J2NP66_9HEXA|nr:unnamed protein product [Allacma fusca]